MKSDVLVIKIDQTSCYLNYQTLAFFISQFILSEIFIQITISLFHHKYKLFTSMPFNISREIPINISRESGSTVITITLNDIFMIDDGTNCYFTLLSITLFIVIDKFDSNINTTLIFSRNYNN